MQKKKKKKTEQSFAATFRGFLSFECAELYPGDSLGHMFQKRYIKIVYKTSITPVQKISVCPLESAIDEVHFVVHLQICIVVNFIQQITNLMCNKVLQRVGEVFYSENQRQKFWLNVRFSSSVISQKRSIIIIILLLLLLLLLRKGYDHVFLFFSEMFIHLI